MHHLGMGFRRYYGDAGLMVGFNDLEGAFQP